MKKITFLGDIVCDRPLLKAAKQGQTFDFDTMFMPLKKKLAESDVVVGALETTFSGEKFGYNSRSFAYNSPDELAESIRNCGINTLTTANNHCLDYGVEGVKRTVKVLNNLNISHTGTLDYGKPYLLLESDGAKIAILSYSAVMNMKPGAKAISQKEKDIVNLITEVNPRLTPILLAKRLIPSGIRETMKTFYYQKKVNGSRPTITVMVDNNPLSERDNVYIQGFIDAAKSAKKEADIVIACIHCGGQFNKNPGRRTKELFKRIAPYVDGIVGNHPHVIQLIEKIDNVVLAAYSLGTMNLSMSADYISFENLPQYSLALHFYISKSGHSIQKITGSILVSKENQRGYVTVYPVNELLETSSECYDKVEQDIRRILLHILPDISIEGKIEVKDEYLLWE